MNLVSFGKFFWQEQTHSQKPVIEKGGIGLTEH